MFVEFIAWIKSFFVAEKKPTKEETVDDVPDIDYDPKIDKDN